MTEEPTAEMISDLRTKELPIEKRHAIANRLVELEDANRMGWRVAAQLGNEIHAIRALLPDGVTIEQLVATYNAVHDDRLFCGDLTYRYHLRSVKP